MRVLVCLAGLFLLAGCTTLDSVTGKKTRNFYSIDKDVAIGSEVQAGTLTALEKSGTPVNANPQQVAMLETMVRRIAAVSDLPDLPYEVTLIHTNIVNAMAAPGGKIMVYEGLWDPQNGLARTEDEIAAVIAHEIAHVNARHSTEAMTRAMPANIAAIGLMALAKDSEHEKVAQMLVAGGMFVVNGVWMTKYSRTDEFEADAVGLMYMAKAGYDPRAAIHIWEQVAARQGRNDPASSIFSTHPSSAARVENLRAKLPEAERIYQSRKIR
ncbi:MAG: M48 family metallopeptidase [Kiritimatiellaceae bacterium]|nr:M48 family metallopeptidase [Kiritimatiellaceae bacterium]